MLIVGCHDAVRLYRLYIDDASELSQRRVAEAIQRVALGEAAPDSITLNLQPEPQSVSMQETGTASTVKDAKAMTQAKKPAGTGHPTENGNDAMVDRTADGGETSGHDAEDQHLDMWLLSRVRGTCSSS